MKHFARIQNGVVAEVVSIQDDQNIAEMFHPDLVFVPCGSACKERMIFDGTNFSDPPPITPVVVIPEFVTARQARLALLAADLLDDAEVVIAAADRATQIAWEYATEFRRDHPLIATLGSQLDLDVEAVDELFTAAAKL